MTILEITADMDTEDRNVAHSQNALAYFAAGMVDKADAEVAMDRGFCGTFAQWVEWAAQTLANREAERRANQAAYAMFG